LKQKPEGEVAFIPEWKGHEERKDEKQPILRPIPTERVGLGAKALRRANNHKNQPCAEQSTGG